MSFTSVFPTNLVKFSLPLPAIAVRDSSAGLEQAVFTLAKLVLERKVVVEGIVCRFVDIGDIIEPEDYNCKVDILFVIRDRVVEISSVIEFIGW